MGLGKIQWFWHFENASGMSLDIGEAKEFTKQVPELDVENVNCLDQCETQIFLRFST